MVNYIRRTITLLAVVYLLHLSSPSYACLIAVAPQKDGNYSVRNDDCSWSKDISRQTIEDNYKKYPDSEFWFKVKLMVDNSNRLKQEARNGK